MKSKKIFLVLLIALSLTVVFAGPVTVRKISIDGNEKLSRGEILEMLSIPLRTQIEQESLEASVSALKDSGYFEAVSFSFDESSGLLSVTVKEYPPVIASFSYFGPKLINVDTLEASGLSFKNGYPMKPYNLIYEIPRTKEKLAALFEERGYFEPFYEIEWETSPEKSKILSEEVDGPIEVHFIVKTYYLWDIELQGDFSEEVISILKDRLKLKTLKSYYDKQPIARLLLKKKDYTPKKEDIINAVKNLYSSYILNKEGPWDQRGVYQLMVLTLNNAFQNIKTAEVPSGVEPSKVITFYLKPADYIENPMELKSIFIEGNENLSELQILTTSGLKEGETVTNEKIALAVDSVYKLFSESGYLFTSITTSVDAEKGFLKFGIHEPKVRDIRIEFVDNQKTREYLIWDKIVIQKGKTLNLKDYRNTYAFLNATNYFESVVINPVPIDKDTLDVVITLDEKEKNGKFMGGGGWQNGLNLNLDVGILNPFGYGQDIATKLTVSIPIKGDKKVEFDETLGATTTTTSSPTYNITLNYTLPKVGGSNWDLQTSAAFNYYGKTEITEEDATVTTTSSRYTEISFAFSPKYRISAASKFGFSTGFEFISKESIVATESTSPSSETENTGFDGLYLSANYDFSTRDDLLRPNSGSEFSFAVYMRGLLGSFNQEFLGLRAGYKKFIRLGETDEFAQSNTNPVIGLRLSIEQLLPLNNGVYEKYLLSPDFFIRVKTSSLLGQHSYGVTAGSLQLRFPLSNGSVPVDLTAFVDAVFYRNDPTSWDIIGMDNVIDFGLSLDLSIPMIGVIRVGYGYNSYLFSETTEPYWGTFFFGFGPAF
ncbi:BamA/OMP85 family outer membrane protein [Kosmotoga pacifica]|uniref:POTRA domain-containing protein n=1 Tax=Kosmotoga pacifica TaxID=1330330 RepID=A0A0G2Z4L8_9BACT|nr:POTRA domain-containing protein [Kosmotoga pacifica]AKI96492.1 hypothetical protein IX53_00110 [Kosmotoga pacifica]